MLHDLSSCHKALYNIALVREHIHGHVINSTVSKDSLYIYILASGFSYDISCNIWQSSNKEYIKTYVPYNTHTYDIVTHHILCSVCYISHAIYHHSLNHWGCWGTRDDFTTSILQLCFCFAALWDL